jgi:hypothetical protein
MCFPAGELENASGMKFCGECGVAEGQVPGFANAPGIKFCGECGKPRAEAAKKPTNPNPRSYTPKHLAEKILSRDSVAGFAFETVARPLLALLVGLGRFVEPAYGHTGGWRFRHQNPRSTMRSSGSRPSLLEAPVETIEAGEHSETSERLRHTAIVKMARNKPCQTFFAHISAPDFTSKTSRHDPALGRLIADFAAALATIELVIVTGHVIDQSVGDSLDDRQGTSFMGQGLGASPENLALSAELCSDCDERLERIAHDGHRHGVPGCASVCRRGFGSKRTSVAYRSQAARSCSHRRPPT